MTRAAEAPTPAGRGTAGPGMFTEEQVERARRYHRPLYVAFAVEAVLSFAMLVVLAFTGGGDRLFQAVDGLAWWASTPLFVSIVVGASFVLGLPLSFWRGYLREKRWGFSTQTVAGWLGDRAKGVAVGLVLSAGLLTGLMGLARALPDGWPLVAAPAAALLVLVLSLVAPVVLEPLFNRFAPLSDANLAEELRDLSVQAGVPVRDVLVADASRRTKKENAYVSGLGRTRRVVVYDTLLARDEPRQVRLVVAHELGHRRMRHVAVSTVVGMAGIVAAVVILWALLRTDAIRAVVGATGPGDPRVVPFVMLAGATLQLVAMPLETFLSRRWERAADRFSLELTADPGVFEESHRALALSNLSDLVPARLLYLLTFTHPTPPERVAMARRWATERGSVVSTPTPSTTA